MFRVKVCALSQIYHFNARVILTVKSEGSIAPVLVCPQASHPYASPFAVVVLHTYGVGQLRMFVNDGNDQLNAHTLVLCNHAHLVASLAVVGSVGQFKVIAMFVKVDKGIRINLLQFS